MPYKLGELLDGAVLYSEFIDEINDELLVTYALELYDKGFLTSYQLELVDGRKVHNHAVTRQGLEKLANLARQSEDLIRGRRVAMVAGDDVTFGMFRMWELKREDLDYEVMVFRDFDEALVWLDSFVNS